MARAAIPDHLAALVAHLRAHVPSVDGEVWTPPLPPHARFPRLVVGADADERYFGHYGEPGADSSILIKGYWRPDPERPTYGSGPIAALWGEVKEALDGVAISVAGHQQLSGEVELQRMYLDPDGVTHQLAARYTARTLVEAA